MSKFFKTIIFSSLAVTCLLLLSSRAEAAVISLYPAEQKISENGTIIVEIRLNSEQQVVNAVQATITYPVELLEVLEVSTGGSFLTLWPAMPVDNANDGIVTMTGGRPQGSYVTNGKIASITFRAKAGGLASVAFDQISTSVHLNDGLGTAAPLTFINGTYDITSPSVEMTITSPTHPREEKWYSHNSPVIRWTVEKEAEYSYVLGQNPGEIPDDEREIEVGEVHYKNLPDGIYYFSLRKHLPGKNWEMVGRRRILIDITPPLALKYDIGSESTLYNNDFFLTFSSTDVASGVDHYDVVENGINYFNSVSPYRLRDQSLRQPLMLRAVDKAGNKTELWIRGEPVPLKTKQTKDLFWVMVILTAALLSFLTLINIQTSPKK